MFLKIIRFFLNLIRITLRNPNDLRHIFGVADSVTTEIVNPLNDTRSLERVDILDICEGTSRWTVQSFPSVGASVSPLESMALAALSERVEAKRIFEFGTYKGVSTTQLALNVGQEGMVFTLDLPEDHPAYLLPIPKPEERAIAAESGKGILIPRDLLSRVTFLQFDSATFDTSPYISSMDLIFIDAAHSYEYVKNDSLKGWEMLKPGGIMAWHDCNPNHPGVVRYLKESGHKVSLIQGTTLAFVQKP